MDDLSLQVQSAVMRLLEAGFQISPSTLEMLKTQIDPSRIVDKFLADKSVQPHETPVLEPEHLVIFLQQEKIEDAPSEDHSEPQILPTVTRRDAPARDMKADIKVLKDPTTDLRSRGQLDDFVANFRDRYVRLRHIISQRFDGKGIIDIQDLGGAVAPQNGSRGRTCKIVGLITNKMLTKTGNLALELEDPTGSIIAVVPRKNTALTENASQVMLDQIICVEGSPVSAEMLIVQDLFLPDVPGTRRKNQADEDVSVVLISDIHFGSRHFLDQIFRRFLRWLQIEDDNEQAALAGTVKYLVIAGDLVDGIGVYPKQIDDLVIHDIDNQYAGLAKLLQEIPDHIHVIISPGNHDGVRNAIPRPSIGSRFLEPLEEAGLTITSLGCPCQVAIHGVNLLIFHGDSLIDMMGSLSTPDFEGSFPAMRQMIRGRHLAPIYGKGTSIVAEPRDWLVIDEVPDILHCGHVHVTSLGNYRGTLIVNSGTFQSQTEYQRSIGIEPTPGVIPIVNLRTSNVNTLKFI